MGAEVFASPYTVLATIFLVAVFSSFHYWDASKTPAIGVRELIRGYFFVVLVNGFIAGLESYVSKPEAVLKWKIPPENYWHVLFNSFVVTYILSTCAVLMGIATVGLPIIMALGRRGKATVPWVLLASVPPSVFVAIVLSSRDRPAFRHLGNTLEHLTIAHVILALSFCLGASIPWRILIKKSLW
jgi:hypothetical protein